MDCTPGRVTCTLGAVRCGRGLQLGGLEKARSGCASNPGQPGGAGGVLSGRPMHPAPPPRAPWPQSTRVPRPAPPQSASCMRCPAPRWGFGRTPHRAPPRTRHGWTSSTSSVRAVGFPEKLLLSPYNAGLIYENTDDTYMDFYLNFI